MSVKERTRRKQRPAIGQLELFSPLAKRRGPPAVPVATSIAAAERIQLDAPTLRGKVYQEIISAGRGGCTRQEIADQLDMKLQTVCGRCKELLDFGLIYQTNDTRDGRKILFPKRC